MIFCVCACPDSKWSSDSDFRDSEYSEEEDLSLCNTTLITGPHGVGKTASVYALAQEMGFKVQILWFN